MAKFGRFAAAGSRGALHPSTVLIFAALVAGGLACGISPTFAQQCVTSGNDITCSNSGSIPGSILTTTITGNVATINSGSVGGSITTSTITGNATTTNSGSVGSNIATVTITGNATTTNSGSVGSNIATITTIGDATTTNSGSVGTNIATITTNGNATTTNSGSVGSNIATITTIGDATTTNSGSVGTNIATITTNGNATTTNSGSAGSNVTTITTTGDATATNSGSVGTNMTTIATTGNATASNSGSVGSNITTITTNGDATASNSGSVATNITTITTTGNATTTNSGSVGTNVTNITTNGNATVINRGIIGDGVTDISSNGIATLTNFAGSRIIGAITLAGTTKVLNFVGGNFLYTLNSLTGVAINTNGAPFAVNGNSVAVLDPTALALEDRSVMNFTGGVSSMLKDRFNGMPVAGGAVVSAMGFAPEAANRMDAAHNAFSGMPSISMSYSSTEAKRSNANAMYTKAPALAAPVYDTVVWASGFGGERRQWENGPIQRATDNAFGGAIGIDRQFTPDLRLGAFVGGGNSRLNVAYNIQNVDSDYVFGGGYGRWDKRNYYVDFALFGGSLSSNSTRQISNNNVASGLEIATASYHGWFFSPDVTYGYRYFTGDYVFTPKARVRYVGGSLDGYTEAGSAQGLTMGKRNLSDIEERLGVEFASVRPVTFGGTLKTSVEVSGLGLQRLGDNAINAVLLAQNIAFTTPGSSQAFGGVVNLGLDWRPKSNVSVYASVEATAMNDKSFSATGKGGIRVGF
jgi:uncharacterized protein with beta-barrel porin domain